MAGPDDKGDKPATTPHGPEQPTTPHQTPAPSEGMTDLGLAEASLRDLGQRYENLAEIGRGGMGVVYRARDRETGEIVALKVLKPEIAHRPDLIARFKSELRLARKITHKNVCRTYDLHRLGDTAAIAMEFVEGESLREILSRYSPLSVRKGVEWARQICAGLTEAHAQGVVHRDLKPANIVIDREGNAKVMDFGIARSVEAEATQAGITLGTPAYMSPEQASGKPADARSDIYSLGLVLYEMFTGRPALQAESPAVFVVKQMHETPPPPREVEPYLPAFLDRAIQRCLEKNPAKRFQSVNELEAALTREPEAKPAAVEGEGAEVAVPISLATWQRSDWFLLASGVLGAVVFFFLFYHFHPASASVITIDAEQQRQITADTLKKLQWDVKVGKPWLVFNPKAYYGVASFAGNRVARDRVLRSGIMGSWSGNLRALEGDAKSAGVDGQYETDLIGRPHYLRLYPPGAGAAIQPGPAPDESSMAKMKAVAQTAAQTLFGEDLSATKAESRAYWNVPHQSWHVGFSWPLPQHPQGFVTYVNVQVEGSRMVSAWTSTDFESSAAEQSFDSEAYSPPLRCFVAGQVIVLFTSFLFFARKVYREPRSPQNLRLAVLIGLGGAVAISPDLPEFGGPGEAGTLSGVVWGGLTFSIFTLLSYVVLNAVLYYLRRRFPIQTANYLQLFREHVFARTAGLEILRGVFAGAAFGGVWLALVSLAGVWGKALAGMPFWLEVYSGFAVGFVQIISPFQARVFPVLMIGEVLLIGWLLVALPLSLLGRATARWRFLLAALSALWLALGFSLAGAMVFPTWPYLIFVVLQAIFCGVVFLRFGLLATLSAVFTIEVGLLAFPLLEIFHNIDPLPYEIPVVLWFMLLMAATGIYLRPQVVGAYRRVAAVFE
jgi:predicted Ser/Thr protein kinase